MITLGDDMENRKSNAIVYKANRLIEARYSLDLIEQKIILYAASKIDHLSDETFPTLKLSVSEFFKLSGQNKSKNHEYMRTVAKGLMKKQLEIQSSNGGWELIQWVTKSKYEPNEGIISFQFHPDMVPLLLKLKKHYKGYPLQQVMQFSSKYSIRLYELLIQWEHSTHKSLTIEVEELRKKLGVKEGEYKRFDSFDDRVIKTAINEINNKSNIFVTYEKLRKGRRIHKIKFKFEIKDDANIKEIEQLKKLIEAGLATHIDEIKKEINDKDLVFTDSELDKAYTIAYNKLINIKSIEDNLKEAIYKYIAYYYEYTKDKANPKAYKYFIKALEEDYHNIQAILKFAPNPDIIKYGDLK